MKIELDDQILTAYALGELDFAESKAVEHALAEAARTDDDAPQRVLDEIRATIAIAQDALKAGAPDGALTPDQRDAVGSRADEAQALRPFAFPWRAAGLAAAALAVIAVYGSVNMLSESPWTRETKQARVETPAEKAQREFNELQALQPGIERFFITDINNPGVIRPNFGDVGVQNQVTELRRQLMPTSAPGLVPESAPAQAGQSTPLSVSLATPADGQAVVEGIEPSQALVSGTLLSGDQLASNASPRLLSVGRGATLGDAAGNDGVETLPQQFGLPLVPSPKKENPQQEAALMRSAAVAAQAPAPNASHSSDLSLNVAALPTEERERLRSLGYLTDDQSDTDARLGMSFNASGGRYQVSRVESWSYPQPAPPAVSPGAEVYKPIIERGFTRVGDEPLSTFSIDVDTASYANVRRFLQQGLLPPPDAVRVEEMINYFDYAYGRPEGNTPFAAHFEMAACPWEPQHTLVRIGLKGREIPRAERPATNLVFLIDVSGSMQPANKLPLVKWAMSQLASQLDERDRVAVVTYASGVSLALPSTNAGNQQAIQNAIATLGAGGSTNGAGGIQMAYEVARRNFLPGGVNRVILATDGDFNVGLTDNGALEQMIQSEARTGVFLSVYGYGMGNLKDDRLEMLADKGNGAYGYIDSETEARREFIEKLSGTLVTIAKDVKVQVEFNPARVGAYRLIGYENRALAAQDFNDDRKDAGEIGAGHTVTALYEVVPAGRPVPSAAGTVDSLRYQPTRPAAQVEAAAVAPEAHPARSAELLTVKLRYKEAEGHESKLLEFPLTDSPTPLAAATGDFKFASAVAAFGKLLRGNPLGASLNYDGMMQLAQAGLQGSSDAHRAEMISLMLQARPMLEVRGIVDGRYSDSTLQ